MVYLMQLPTICCFSYSLSLVCSLYIYVLFIFIILFEISAVLLFILLRF